MFNSLSAKKGAGVFGFCVANCALDPVHFTDYLFMAAESGEWKVVFKTTMTVIKYKGKGVRRWAKISRA